jgi:hypothetical protein
MDGSRWCAALLVQTVQDLERRVSKDGTPDIDGQTDGHRVGREEGVRDCSRRYRSWVSHNADQDIDRQPWHVPTFPIQSPVFDPTGIRQAEEGSKDHRTCCRDGRPVFPLPDEEFYSGSSRREFDYQ